MKQLTLTFVALLCLGTMTFAQFNTGDKFASGSTNISAGFSTTRNKSTNYTSDPTHSSNFALDTKAGYFLKQKFALGAMIGLSTSSQKSGDYKTIYNSMMLGPVVRYYRGSYEGFSPFAEALVGFGIGSNKSVSTESTYKDKESMLELAAGIGSNYFFTDNIALEGMLQYSFLNTKPGGENPYNEHYVKGSLNLLLGITVYFSSL